MHLKEKPDGFHVADPFMEFYDLTSDLSSFVSPSPETNV